jgi:nucleoporin NUP159
VDQVTLLQDEEDERIRALLAEPIQPTLELAEFLAHQDYVGLVTKDGITGSIERIYRDVNSMIDTLGLNSRSLAAFIAGHSELLNENEGTQEELEDTTKDWRLEEITKLATIEDDLDASVNKGSISKVLNAFSDLGSLNRDVGILKQQVKAIRGCIETHASPTERKKRRTADLDPAWTTEQATLRARIADVTRRMAQAEDDATLLRAKIASRAKTGKGVPTVEAVENTIRKMTTMIEKRSGDIDVLEMQMRKLGLIGASAAANSTAGSLEHGKTFGLTYDESDEEDDPAQRARELAIEERVQRSLALRKKRAVVLNQLRQGLEKRNADSFVVVKS